MKKVPLCCTVAAAVIGPRPRVHCTPMLYPCCYCRTMGTACCTTAPIVGPRVQYLYHFCCRRTMGTVCFTPTAIVGPRVHGEPHGEGGCGGEREGGECQG